MRGGVLGVALLCAVSCDGFDDEIPMCADVNKPVIDHTLLGHGLYFDNDPGETDVFLDAADYDAFRARVRPDLPDVDFTVNHVLVTSARVEDACDVRMTGYAVVEEAAGLAHVGMTLESERDTCDIVCTGPKWYTIVLTVPAGHGGSACSSVTERCG